MVLKIYTEWRNVMMKRLKFEIDVTDYVTTDILDSLKNSVTLKIYSAISFAVSYVSFRQVILDGLDELDRLDEKECIMK